MRKSSIRIDGKDYRLKACPFCGNNLLQLVEYKPDGVRRFTIKYAVLCNYEFGGCGTESGHYKSAEEAFANWNMRKGK